MSALHCQRLACTGGAEAAPELVLIHGWGKSSAVWAPWLSQLRRHCHVSLLDLPGYGASAPQQPENSEVLLEQVLAVAPERAIYLGYSLGGMLATLLAARYPERVQALVTLASNARFVVDESWPWAMEPAAFEQFYQSLAKPAQALKRFAGLQAHGCDNDKALLKTLREHREALSQETLTQGLDWLRTLDVRPALADLVVPALFCFAHNDALVPAAAAEHWPTDNTVVIEGAAHALFLSHPEATAQQVLGFLRQQTLIADESPAACLRNKRDVARSFSRAATTYDSVAELQRRVGQALFNRLPDDSDKPHSALVDLGCGTGYFSQALQQRYPDAPLIGIDLAEGMARFARQRMAGATWLCGDAENLPLAENSVSLIFSSLTIQWCENLDAVFAEARRVLEPGGLFLFSTLGPDTLHELREAWEQVDGHVHVNRFCDWSTVRDAIARAGFAAASQPQQESVVMQYHTVRELAAELKGLGASNSNSGRPAGMTGRQRLAALEQAYERHRNAGGLLPATYQVWYGALRREG